MRDWSSGGEEPAAKFWASRLVVATGSLRGHGRRGEKIGCSQDATVKVQINMVAIGKGEVNLRDEDHICVNL